MFSKSVAVLAATLVARTFLIAAVQVVLPWSTCPIVPMLQCGLLLSNLALAILNVLLVKHAPRLGNYYFFVLMPHNEAADKINLLSLIILQIKDICKFYLF